MKRKVPKLGKKKIQNKNRGTHGQKDTHRHGRVRRKKVGGPYHIAITDPRVVRALGAMRREGISASQAARHERMKLKTFRERAGRYLYRSGSGKPWKAPGEAHLALP